MTLKPRPRIGKVAPKFKPLRPCGYVKLFIYILE